MEESYVEGLATHGGPESCAVAREGGGGAFFLCGTCGTGNRRPSQRFDDVVNIYVSLGGDK